MNKKRYALWTSTIVTASLFLSGCQLLTGYQKIEEAGSAKAWVGEIQPIDGEVNIACVGTYHCEIVQIDNTLIVSPDSHEPANPQIVEASLSHKATKKPKINMDMAPLINKDAIRIVPLAASGMPNLTNYYARVMPAKHEVHVNFYPEKNMGYVERFAVIHDFVESSTYQLRAYQKPTGAKSGSLLETASPEPLCIDLLQGNEVQRRFCKQLGTEQQGEFVEADMTSTVTSVPKSKKTTTS